MGSSRVISPIIVADLIVVSVRNQIRGITTESEASLVREIESLERQLRQEQDAEARACSWLPVEQWPRRYSSIGLS